MTIYLFPSFYIFCLFYVFDGHDDAECGTRFQSSLYGKLKHFKFLPFLFDSLDLGELSESKKVCKMRNYLKSITFKKEKE